MSAPGLPATPTGPYGYPQTLMMYDIPALQKMYGANYTTNSGDTVYTWNPLNGRNSINGVGQGLPGGNRIFMTIWDGGGHDTYDFSNYTTNLHGRPAARAAGPPCRRASWPISAAATSRPAISPMRCSTRAMSPP